MLSSIYKLENNYPYHCFAMYVAFMGTYVAAALSNDEKGLDNPERLFPVLVGVGASLSQAYHLHQIVDGVKPSEGALVAHSIFLGNFWQQKKFEKKIPKSILNLNLENFQNFFFSDVSITFASMSGALQSCSGVV